jgi:hypothetical protein
MQSYGAPKLRESQPWQFPDSSPGTKSHLDVGPMERCTIYYKGEGGGFPPSLGRGESCMSVLPVAHLSTKGVPTMH